MEKIRIGNDINIKWEIYASSTDGTIPYDLTGKDINLYVKAPYCSNKIEDMSINGHVVSFIFRGKDQKRMGIYKLILVENEGKDGMHTVDECNAFALVGCTCHEENGSESGINVESVGLKTTANIGAVSGESGGAKVSFENLVEIPNWEYKDGKIYIPEEYFMQATNGYCAILYHGVIYYSCAVVDRNYIFASPLLLSTSGEFKFYSLSVNLKTRELEENTQDVNFLEAFAMMEERLRVLENKIL